MAVLHEPNLGTVAMIEKAVLEAKNCPSRMELWNSLPRKVQYQTFKRALEYLEAQGTIAYNGGTIIYTGVNNDKLRAFIESCVRVD
jgi:DNA-binding transcriptional regulator YhcF (GntR family)